MRAAILGINSGRREPQQEAIEAMTGGEGEEEGTAAPLYCLAGCARTSLTILLVSASVTTECPTVSGLS